MRSDGSNEVTYNGNKYSLQTGNSTFLDFLCNFPNCASKIRVFCGAQNSNLLSNHNHGNENLDPVPNIVKTEDIEENFAEIVTDAKNERWLFIDGFRFKKLAQNKNCTE